MFRIPQWQKTFFPDFLFFLILSQQLQGAVLMCSEKLKLKLLWIFGIWS